MCLGKVKGQRMGSDQMGQVQEEATKVDRVTRDYACANNPMVIEVEKKTMGEGDFSGTAYYRQPIT